MRDLDPPRRLLMGSGPSSPQPRVLRAMALPPLPPEHPEYAALMSRITCGLRELFCANSTVPQIVPGASRSGIESVLNSLIEPGDRVVVGVYGHFGELLCTLATRHGAEVVRVEAEWGRIVEPANMIEAIRSNRTKLAAIVHSRAWSSACRAGSPPSSSER